MQDIVGPCLNLIPARIQIGADNTFRELFQQIHKQQVAMIAYESTPFEQIARQARWPASTRLASIFQYQNLPDQEISKSECHDNEAPWEVTGYASYGDFMLQIGACRIMAWPEANVRALFRFMFNEENSVPVESRGKSKLLCENPLPDE